MKFAKYGGKKLKNFTAEQARQARITNLYDYLLTYHPDDFQKEGDSIRPLNNHSLSIRRDYSGYMDFATGEKGNSIDFLQKYMGYSVVDAVLALCEEKESLLEGEYRGSVQIDVEELGNAMPLFPKPNSGAYSNLFAYLISRGISVETIQTLVDFQLIYQDCNNNIIFVNDEKDWGERRGTNSYADARCIHRRDCANFNAGEHQWCTYMKRCERYKKDAYRGMIANSRRDGYWGFQNRTGRPEKVYVCEASIDAISLYELHQMDGINENALYVSIGGAAKQSTIDKLKQDNRVIIAVDNDEAGAECRNRNTDVEYIIPKRKDWNEDLIGRRN